MYSHQYRSSAPRYGCQHVNVNDTLHIVCKVIRRILDTRISSHWKLICRVSLTFIGCAKTMLNAVYGHSGMLAAIFWGAGTMLVAVYGLTGMLATVFGCAKTMLNAVYGHSGMLLAVCGCAGTILVAVHGLTGVLLSVSGRAGIMPHSDWNCTRSCRNQMRRLQMNAVSDMQLIAMMLTTAIKISMWNDLPVEKSLDWHNTINLQGAGARNKLLTAHGLQQYWGALETCLCLCLLACWLPHLGTLELCLRVYLDPLTCWQQYHCISQRSRQCYKWDRSPAKSASWQGCRSAWSDVAEPADACSSKTKKTGSRARNSRSPGRHERAQHRVLWQA